MIVSDSTRKCATCQYWSGDRVQRNFGRQVEFNPSDRGSCNKPGSTSRLLENKTAQMTCSDWELWGVME